MEKIETGTPETQVQKPFSWGSLSKIFDFQSYWYFYVFYSY